MLPYLRDQYGNASSRHEFGTLARKAVNEAREQVAALVGVQPVQLDVYERRHGVQQCVRQRRGRHVEAQPDRRQRDRASVRRQARAGTGARGWKLRKLAVDRGWAHRRRSNVRRRR